VISRRNVSSDDSDSDDGDKKKKKKKDKDADKKEKKKKDKDGDKKEKKKKKDDSGSEDGSKDTTASTVLRKSAISTALRSHLKFENSMIEFSSVECDTLSVFPDMIVDVELLAQKLEDHEHVWLVFLLLGLGVLVLRALFTEELHAGGVKNRQSPRLALVLVGDPNLDELTSVQR